MIKTRRPVELVESARPVDLDPIRTGRHEPVVYFVLNGTRIKIGYTTNVASRLRAFALPADSVLLLLSGGARLEAALHRRFTRYRVGDTEWFDISVDILRYVGSRLNLSTHRTGERKPVKAARLAPPSEERVQARSTLERIIGDFKTQGRRTVQTRDFTPHLKEIGRSRPWVVAELRRLVEEGHLIPGPGCEYVIASGANT